MLTAFGVFDVVEVDVDVEVEFEVEVDGASVTINVGTGAGVGDIEALDLLFGLIEFTPDVLVELDRMRVDERGPFLFEKTLKISLSPKELMIIYYWYYFS